MEPGIGSSIRQGFQVANRSWVGVGFLATCWIVLGLLAVGTLSLTKVPWEALRQAPQEDTGFLDEETDMDMEEESTDETAVEDDLLTPQQREQADAISGWLSGAWPVLVLWVLALIAASLWLQGGQIGYLSRLVTTEQARVSEFWKTGSRVFLPLLGGWAISFFAVVIIAALIALVVWLVSLIPLPGFLQAILGILSIIALLVGLVWLSARVLFWFIAIVTDNAGPVSGLTSSFHVTAGRMKKVLGLLGLIAAISIGVALLFALIEGLAGFAGGAGGVITLISNLLGAVVNLYLGFAFLAAFIRFYVDAKAPAVSTPSGSLGQRAPS